MKTQQHRPLVHWLSVAAMVLLSACGAGSVDQAEATAQATDGAGPQTANECGTAGFPCTLDRVPLAVLARSDELADELLRRLNQGASMAELLAFVRGQAGVVDAAIGASALRFRLAGGRDVLIIDPPVPSAAAKASASNAATSLAAPANPLPPTAAPAAPADERKFALAVAGDGGTQKRALVLSPFKYQFEPFDDGAAVAQRLAQTRGYAGQVSYLANATRTAATVGIQQFAGWQQFDVIHVSSHGARVCDVNRCLSVILTGDIYSNASDLLRLTEAGLNTARVRGSDDKLLALGPDYFKQHYPGGLARKIVFFNACETFDVAGKDLGAALRGPQSVYLGWTDAVESDAATNAALALYRELSDHGVTSAAALDKLGPLAVNQYRHRSNDITATLRLARDPAGDLRLREVVTIERLPAGGMLPPGASVAAVGTANDGVVDQVAYRVLVEGIALAQQDAALMQFRVDGHASTPQAVTIGERVGDTGWRLFGQIPFADVTPQQQVEMVATVQLPEGGSSEHRVTVKLTADPPGVGETWVGEAVNHFDETTPQGQVHVTRVASVIFKQVPSTIGARYKVLRSVGGRMTWSRSGTVKTAFDAYCAYSFGPMEVAMADGDGELIIDTSQALHPYALSGFTQGAEVRLAENCGAYAFSTRAGGAWAPALAAADGHRASADGREITGVTGNDQSTWTWRFRRQ